MALFRCGQAEMSSEVLQSTTEGDALSVDAREGRGRVLVEIFRRLEGESLDALESDARFPNHPTSRGLIHSLSELRSLGPRYGLRVRGTVRLPNDGRLMLVASGPAELLLSPDGSPSRARKVESDVAIVGKDAPRYFEIRFKNSSSQDFLSLRFRAHGQTEFEDVSVAAMAPHVTRRTVPSTTEAFDLLAGAHPRILASEFDFERLKSALAHDATLSRWYERLLAQADAWVLAGPLEPPVSAGVVSVTQAYVRAVLSRTLVLSFAYRMTADGPTRQRYLDAAYAGLVAAAGPDLWLPPERLWHYLEVGEMSFAFAVGYDWLFDGLSETQARNLARPLYKKGVLPFATQYLAPLFGREVPGWFLGPNNWNFVCNAGAALGALALGTDYDDFTDVSRFAFATAVRGLAEGQALREFHKDGMWPEGPGYWRYGTDMLVSALASMEVATGADFGITAQEGFMRTGRFRMNVMGPSLNAFNFGDAEEGNMHIRHSPQSFWLARRFFSTNFARHEAQVIEHGGAGGRPLIPSPAALLWYAAGDDTPIQDSPTEVLFPEGQYVSMRSRWNDESASFLGFKGTNYVTPEGAHMGHTHLDTGTFVFEARGQRWAEDLGLDGAYYKKLTATGDYLDYLATRAEGHNTLVLWERAGADQSTTGRAEAPTLTRSEDGAVSVLDMSAVYARPDLGFRPTVRRAVRSFKERTQFLIQDEVTASTTFPFHWSMHFSKAKRTEHVIDDHTVVLEDEGGERLYVKLLSSNANAKFSLHDAGHLVGEGPPEQREWSRTYRKLMVNLLGQRRVCMSVWMVPLAPGEDLPVHAPVVAPLSSNCTRY